MSTSLSRDRRIVWRNVLTVVSAAILIGAEVFGAAFAGGWAVENLTGLGDLIVSIGDSVLRLFGANIDIPARAGVVVLQAVFFAVGVAIMMAFLRTARRVEPFTTRG
jgi:hypothetical protein